MPSLLQSDDGRIWFEANNSFASIDPTEHIRNTLPPTVIIRSITTTDGGGNFKRLAGDISECAHVAMSTPLRALDPGQGSIQVSPGGVRESLAGCRHEAHGLL